MKLTYKQALDMALAAEAARNDAKRLQDHREEVRSAEARPTETEEKSAALNRVTRNTPRTDSHGKTECHRCGGKHPAACCKFKDYECHYCKKKGHLASVCRELQLGVSLNVNRPTKSLMIAQRMIARSTTCIELVVVRRNH